MRVLLLCLAALCACSPAGAGEHVAARSGKIDALAELADSAWAAISRGDTVAMELLRVTEQEHNSVVWPALPASRPVIGYPVDLAWQNIELRNRAARARLIRHFRDHAPMLRGVRCDDRAQRFDTFLVLTNCHVELADPATGAIRPFQLFKDVVVRDGEHRIFRYYFDGE